MRFLFFLPAFSLLAFSLSAQPVSVMREQSQHYGQFGARSETSWDSVRIVEGAAPVSDGTSRSPQLCTLNKRVFGWHPYWVGTVYNNYQWNLLSDLCYFDYAVSPTTGNNTNGSFAWSTSGAVTAAINNGVDVHICATLFGSHTTFFATPAAQQTFISNIISLLQARGGKGVNIDFEGMGASHRNDFTAFMINLSNQLHTAIPNSELTMALYAVDWSSVFDIPALTPYVDLFVIMGYDYYWSGSTTAGPDDPLYNFQTSYNYTLHRSMTFYLEQGMPPAKLLLGLPYYGREWETTAGTIPSATTGNYSATKTYAVVQANANGYYNTAQWDANSFTPYYVYQYLGNWRQCFINTGYSMGKRFDAVNLRGIGGIGIWALGYDDGYMEFWNEIEDKFSTCAVVPCTDTLYDLGGPARVYYNDEDFTYTIVPTGASSVTLNFSAFDTELDYDTLWLFDGPSTASPLIGAFHGTNSPGTVNSSGPALTMRFKSDGGIVNPGWSAIWTCQSDVIQPGTAVTVPSGWITQDFMASFNDSDNVGGSGIAESYYCVSVFNGNYWTANAGNGFFYDDCDALRPEWTSGSGTWSSNNSVVEQSDENDGNANLYASLTQTSGSAYLYEWVAVIDGTGNNRRAGLHYFSDNGSLPNRGNSYFVWFRVDQQALEFYKTISDVFYLQSSVPVSINANTSYQFKVSYNPSAGISEVYINNIFAGSWTDPSPYTSGAYISLRSGNANYKVAEIKVYRSRIPGSPVNITVGSPTADIQYENVSPLNPTYAAMIGSVTRDSARNFSQAITWPAVLVDWTPPVSLIYVYDGASSDINLTTNLAQLEANWCCPLDTNSDVTAYWYCFGTTPGDSDVVGWTNNALSMNVTHTGLSLTPGQMYYCCVRAVNGAGLVSSLCSDGQQADISSGAGENFPGAVARIFPNPFEDVLLLSTQMNEHAQAEITLLDLQGREVVAFGEKELLQGKTELLLPVPDANLAPGAYLLRIRIGTQDIFVNLAHL
ncbi:MAG: N-acetylmuramyl-L-alanine amidase, negative regulator of AmpC, AmpD [Bacteroidetes bacterium]|nr:MAG: N-acetylmuramyl-L-alanine amidase, negative regulator of AmpC, AmpD [Bacteroidota bacterium]